MTVHPSPAASSTVPTGTVLAGRYRLVRVLPGQGTGRLWEARDEVLARVVAVRLLPTNTDGDAASMLAAARHAGRLATPGIARVYDAARETLPTGSTLTYVVGEWVEGTTLAELLVDGPLEPGRAAAVMASAARALAAAHAAGVVHGRMHPGNVLVTANGGVTLTDAGLRTADTPATSAQADTRALGGTLYAALTGRWPLPDQPCGSPTLPPAPRHDNGQVYAPGEVRGRVPRGLDYVVLRSLDEGGDQPCFTSAVEVAAALAPLAGREPERAPADAPPHQARVSHGPPRSWVTALGVAVILAGVLAYAVVSLLHSGTSAHRPPAFRDGGGGNPPARSVLVRIAGASSFNPEGTGPEDPQSVALSYDGKPSTAWFTEIYTTGDFGYLKQGTGLLFDLGRDVTVREVTLTFLQSGQGVQVRAADTAGVSVGNFSVVGGSATAGRALVVHTRRTARYWLIWLTHLPPGNTGGYQGDIAEVRFYG